MVVINAVALAAAAALCFTPSVDAHGWVQVPLARQLCNGDEVRYDTTVSAGSGAGPMRPPYGGAGHLCGDPFGGKQVRGDSNFAGMPCEPQETYEEGGIISLQIDIAANHGGFFEVYICDSKDISQDCFDRHKLTTVEHGVEQWHITYQALQDPSDKRPETYIMDWKLPPGLTCEHCVLQWSWWTAHHCVYPCEESVCGFYANRKNDITRPEASDWQLPICETKYPVVGQAPQIFRNCADMKITPSGGGAFPTTPMGVIDGADMPAQEPAQQPAEEPAEEPAVDDFATPPSDGFYSDDFESGDDDKYESGDDDKYESGDDDKYESGDDDKYDSDGYDDDSHGKYDTDGDGDSDDFESDETQRLAQGTGHDGSGDMKDESKTDSGGDDSLDQHPFFAFLARWGWTGGSSGGSSPSTPQTQQSPVLDNKQNTFSEQDSCTMSRRFLLGEEVLEEEDDVHDISGAGNIMDCGDRKVDEVLIGINHKRKEVHAQPLECSNRAVGVAENFAEIMSMLGHEMYESADNCNLAKFRGRCMQMVAVGEAGSQPTSLPGIDHIELMNPLYVVAGVGYYESNGIAYWTFLLG